MMMNHVLSAAPAAAPASTSMPISTAAAATPRTLCKMNRSWNGRGYIQNWSNGDGNDRGSVRTHRRTHRRNYDMFLKRG
jgi:hypothetical protein